MNRLEEGDSLTVDYDKLAAMAQTVVPVVLQDADSNEVLYVAFANEEALRETFRTGQAVLWSTSRNELWHKGATSGDYLDLVDVRVNCEQNSLLYRVRPRNRGVCHTRDAEGRTRPTCYYRRVEDEKRLSFV